MSTGFAGLGGIAVSAAGLGIASGLLAVFDILVKGEGERGFMGQVSRGRVHRGGSHDASRENQGADIQVHDQNPHDKSLSQEVDILRFSLFPVKA